MKNLKNDVMPALLIYLIKVNVALILFCAGYYFVFRKLTFYTLNRVYLIAALLFSSFYPLVDLSNVLPRHNIAQPLQVTNVQLIYNISNYAKNTRPSTSETFWQYLLIIFWIGVAFMAIRLTLQFASLLNIYRRSVPQKVNNRDVRIIKNEASAFSFWQNIYINPDNYSENEIKSVVAHEDVHVKQWHTLDILLAEISLVFYWFNPGIWLIKKAISENLEFITDREILKQGIDAKGYQYSLLYANFNTSPNAVVNHFNISTIKKRIMMMNAKKSSVFSLTRYGLMMPAIAALLLVFGTSKAELIKKGLNQANEITTKALNTAQNAVMNHKDEVAPKTDKVVPHTQKPADTQLNAIAGVSSTIQTILSKADTPKRKSVPLRTIVAGSGADSAYYLLNGRHISYQQVQDIIPDDISSINVLKGTSATSLFGDVAAKGAVLIITKGQENSADVQHILQGLPAANAANKTDKSALTTGPAAVTLKMDSVAKADVDATKRVVGAIGSKVKNREITVRGYASPKKEITVGPNGPLTTVITNGYPTHSATVQKADLASPLFIINGKPATKEDFDKLDPKRIESINVVKDSSAKAIWGTNAKDGVILITTKDGTKGTSKN
ncbi:M56 family metallopeptidase [Mucilaginibacter sp. CSA2-8R]|uniref:M56 family metallopeptidase n=1 Tax=Mucilaginibacter sp. CSA2-8R TaxID=3141542 RepID=UPI00315D0572